MSECPVTLYETTHLTRRDGERTRPYPCGQPVVRYGLCAKHAGDHERLCDGCGRCGR